MSSAPTMNTTFAGWNPAGTPWNQTVTAWEGELSDPTLSAQMGKLRNRNITTLLTKYFQIYPHHRHSHARQQPTLASLPCCRCKLRWSRLTQFSCNVGTINTVQVEYLVIR